MLLMGSSGHAQVLAKIGSARNKPAKQTLILPRAVAGLMQVGVGDVGPCTSFGFGWRCPDRRGFHALNAYPGINMPC